ncbi:MAG: hypothetical protein KKD44_23865 [Proteobacteria bacterium]|nr:hypothetical protein [Pseudomonadota bacterium]
MQPDTPRKLKALQSLYRIHENTMAPFDLACHKGCSVCCTPNVTLTSLEAFYLLSSLGPVGRDRVLSRILDKSHQNHFIPKITINAMVDLCMKGEDLPDEDSDPAWGACPLLDKGICTIYAFRPFGCRCMVSKKKCGDSGCADMDEFLVTVHNVFMQYLEHLDQHGVSANLNDLLPFMASGNRMEDFRLLGQLKTVDPLFLKNMPLSMVMVPPEHRKDITPILSEIQTI